MKYPAELILPFGLLFFLITVYIALKIFSCNCYTTTIFNNSGNRRQKQSILILDTENSFNGARNRNNNSTTFNLWCCFCVVVNRCRSTNLVYVQDADKIQYGTVNNPSAPTTGTSTQNATIYENPINDVCPICFEEFSEKLKVVQLRCHHVFHSSCIAKWFNRSTSYQCVGTCPLCKDCVDTQVICNPDQKGFYFVDAFARYNNTFYHQSFSQSTNYGMNV